jgi:hypothetical protein
MGDDEKQRPYPGPGGEKSARGQMPDDHVDAKEYVEEVDEEVPDEHLETRIADTFENRADPPKD